MKTLSFEITNKCNFRCPGCIIEYHKPSSMSLDFFQKIIEETKSFRFDLMTFVGGEVILHPNLEDMIKTVVDKKMKFGFVTNGSLIRLYAPILERYSKSLYRITVSLDGANADIHDKLRQKNSFAKAVEAIKFCSLHHYSVNVNICISKQNLHQMKQIAKLAFSLGASSVKFINIVQTAYNAKLLLSNKEKIFALGKINELARLYPKKIIVTTSFLLNGGTKYCPGMKNLDTTFVDSRGNLSFCCDVAGQGYPIGYLTNHSFDELFSKYKKVVDYLHRMRKLVLRKGKLSPKFMTCEFCNLMLKNLSI